MSSLRHPLVTGAVALTALGLAGCANPPSSAPSASSSSTAGPASGASGSATPLDAEDLALPGRIAGWSAQEAPTPAPTTIDNSPVVMQTGVYSDGTATRLVTLIVTRDKGYLESRRRKTTAQAGIGPAICGTPQNVPDAVTCTRELTGGLIQTTATGSTAQDLGAFTNELYESLG